MLGLTVHERFAKVFQKFRLFVFHAQHRPVDEQFPKLAFRQQVECPGPADYAVGIFWNVVLEEVWQGDVGCVRIVFGHALRR